MILKGDDIPVDDHGLEVLKKSGEEITPGDKSDYYIKTAIRASDGSLIITDPVTNEVVAITAEHHEMHEGDHYFLKTFLDIDGAGTISRFMFTTPDDTRRVHAKALITSNAEFLIEIYEGITTSDDGTPVPGFNNDRDSTNTAGLIAYAAPTVTDEGTLMWAAKIGAGRSPSGVGLGFNYEIIAKRNSKYMFKVTKAEAQIHYVDFDFFWYEHEAKN